MQIDAAALLHPEIAAVKQAMDEGIRANVRSMLLAVPGARRRDPAEIDDLVDFCFLFCSGLFRQRAFEGGAEFDRKARRLTGRLFAGIKAELGGALAPHPAEPLAMAG